MRDKELRRSPGLRGERELLASGRDVLKTLRTLDLARSSAEVGRPVKF